MVPIGHGNGEEKSVVTLTLVVGNPKAGSRTLAVGAAVAAGVRGLLGDVGEPAVIDLAAFGPALLDSESEPVAEALRTVATSSVVVVASPTYKATYTGLLKVFLDRYGNDGLAGTVAVPVMTGAAPIHSLATEVHLRPLLVELGASVPTRGLYVTEDRFGDLDAVVAKWLEAAGPLLLRAVRG